MHSLHGDYSMLDSPAVTAHLNILQSVIARMGANSASVKAWCVTLVSAILVVVADKGNANFAWLAVIPTLLFCFLDAYYLGLEKGFRGTHSRFVRKLHDGTVSPADLFQVVPEGSPGPLTWAAVWSSSVWPFYMALLMVIGLAGQFVLN